MSDIHVDFVHIMEIIPSPFIVRPRDVIGRRGNEQYFEPQRCPPRRLIKNLPEKTRLGQNPGEGKRVRLERCLLSEVEVLEMGRGRPDLNPYNNLIVRPTWNLKSERQERLEIEVTNNSVKISLTCWWWRWWQWRWRLP